MRLLLVEDSEGVRATMAGLLELRGYQVSEAASLEEARARLAEGSYDAALVDLHLGEELGTALFPELRARCPRIKLVLWSGDLQEGAGADLVLGKELAPLEAIEQVAKLLRG
jgi:two-component system, response regulator RegA